MLMTEQCVVCGEEIPEGRQVCPKCESNMKAKGIVKQVMKEGIRKYGSIAKWSKAENESENTLYGLYETRVTPSLGFFLRMLKQCDLEIRIGRKKK